MSHDLGCGVCVLFHRQYSTEYLRTNTVQTQLCVRTNIFSNCQFKLRRGFNFYEGDIVVDTQGEVFKYIEDITCPRVDMNFIFEWSTRYLTSERSERVRYRVEHEKIKFISISGHVIFCLLYKHHHYYINTSAAFKGAIYYVTITTVISSRVKITCYLHV